MNIQADNPRAVVGDNRSADHAKNTADALARDYPNLDSNVAVLLAEADGLPQEVDDGNKADFVRVIKKIRDEAAKIEAYHNAEKEPFLRAGQAVDQFFLRLVDKLRRRSRNAKAGAADILQARLDDFTDRREREQRARLMREREQREREQREAAERANRERQAAEDARLAADRARKPALVEAKTEAAQQQEAKADLAGVMATIAADKLAEAQTAAAARPADLVRERLGDGAMLTGRKEGYAEIVDESLLDKTALWPFISLEAKDKAVRAWAKTTGYKVQMDGLVVGHRTKAGAR